jgi:hypothetical protein
MCTGIINNDEAKLSYKPYQDKSALVSGFLLLRDGKVSGRESLRKLPLQLVRPTMFFQFNMNLLLKNEAEEVAVIGAGGSLHRWN